MVFLANCGGRELKKTRGKKKKKEEKGLLSLVRLPSKPRVANDPHGDRFETPSGTLPLLSYLALSPRSLLRI